MPLDGSPGRLFPSITVRVRRPVDFAPQGVPINEAPRKSLTENKDPQLNKPSNAVRLFIGLLGLTLLFGLAPSVATAGKLPVHVRAATWEGKILLDRTVRTGTTSVPTSRKATCFGGSPSNGSKKIPGATALGALQDAQAAGNKRKPLLITNAFDFGLGLCGLGGAVAEGEQWWDLTHNNRPATLGGEATVLEKNDTVLWYLAESFNEASPDELYLKAPERVKKDRSFRVRVTAFDDKGRKRPVKGARLSVGGETNARGYTRVRIGKKTRFAARADGLIVSNRVVVRIRK